MWRAEWAEQLFGLKVVGDALKDEELKVEELESGEWRAVRGGIATRAFHSCAALGCKLWVVGGVGGRAR